MTLPPDEYSALADLARKGSVSAFDSVEEVVRQMEALNGTPKKQRLSLGSCERRLLRRHFEGRRVQAAPYHIRQQP